MKKAVIYLRVSTTKQVVEGASLETQQMMCQEWASRNGILVEKIYHDDGVSAKTLNRPAMKEMLDHLIYQKLVFPEGIQYDLSKNVFRTPKLSALYTLASITKDPSMKDESLVVTLPGIEPGLPG